MQGGFHANGIRINSVHYMYYCTTKYCIYVHVCMYVCTYMYAKRLCNCWVDGTW